jgi:hypothetical protein
MIRTRHILSATVCLSLLTGCGGLETDREVRQQSARAYVAAHSGNASDITRAISANRVVKGMNMEQVTAAWGAPVSITKYSDGAEQYWLFGCEWPHRCSGPDIGQSSDELYLSKALFRGGKLVDWQQ